MLIYIFFLLAVNSSMTLFASVAPEESTRSRNPIAAYYEYCCKTFGTSMPTASHKYGSAIPYHLYEGLVLHMRQYKTKKEEPGITSEKLGEHFSCLRSHIQQIVNSHPCLEHVQKLLACCGLEREFEFIPEPPQPRRR